MYTRLTRVYNSRYPSMYSKYIIESCKTEYFEYKDYGFKFMPYKLAEFIAKFFSYVFHPIVFFFIMPYIFVYRFTSSSLYALKWEIFSSVFIFLGLIMIIFGKWRGAFSDFDISRKEERWKFYTLLWFLSFAYLLAAFIFKGIFFPLSITAFGIALGIIIFGIINHYTKASIHTAVACAFAITIGFFYGSNAFLLAFLIVPLVVWSRVVLKKHTIKEAFTGGVFGTAITIFTFLISEYIYNF